MQVSTQTEPVTIIQVKAGLSQEVKQRLSDRIKSVHREVRKEHNLQHIADLRKSGDLTPLSDSQFLEVCKDYIGKYDPQGYSYYSLMYCYERAIQDKKDLEQELRSILATNDDSTYKPKKRLELLTNIVATSVVILAEKQEPIKKKDLFQNLRSRYDKQFADKVQNFFQNYKTLQTLQSQQDEEESVESQ